MYEPEQEYIGWLDFYEVSMFKKHTMYRYLVMNDKCKAIVEQFKLPSYTFFPVELYSFSDKVYYYLLKIKLD